MVGWLFISVSLPRLPAALTSVILTIQPVAAVLLGIILVNEHPSTVQLLGGGHHPGGPDDRDAAAAAERGARSPNRSSARPLSWSAMAPRTVLLSGSGRLCVAQRVAGEPPRVLSPWAMLVHEGRVTWVGDPREIPPEPRPDTVEDLGSALVTPGLVDAHTHPVYAGDRSDEAAARLAGAPYSGGGILRSVAATRAAADADLRGLAAARLRAELAAGTTTVECKSGYGLSTTEELRALRHHRGGGRGSAAPRGPDPPRRARRATRGGFGSRLCPAGGRRDDPAPWRARASREFCDVFCDRGFFSIDEAHLVLAAASANGLGIRLHAEQLARTGATEMGIGLGAVSVDHLEQLDAAGVGGAGRLGDRRDSAPRPGLVLRGGLPPARALLDAGVTVALASDANAGTFGGWGADAARASGLGATTSSA